ncbi:PREDICTED: ancient ubiquitous protein 1, partial [Gekko japonicus]|uniref:Ancient ubiquitous protein 1 n=1 Tax=Gekko japonicus TaxID=146911 RepID=A0ABM1JZ51_GEKJA
HTHTRAHPCACGPPPRFVVRVMCSVLGLLVRQSQPQQRSLRARVYIANHVTHFDHNVINLLTSCNAPMLNGASGFICWSRGFLEVGSTGGRAELLESLKAYSSHGGSPPLLLFPEETTTNGRAGLLRFSTWPFSILDTVQPVALQVQRPFVAVSSADASWVTELLWTFFVPFTIYQVRWLPSVCRRAEETREELALRVQELLALELGVASTRVTATDKAEHLKRLRHSPPVPYAPVPSQPLAARPQASSSSPPAGDPRLMGMAQRVKEVLPHVPLAVIRKDLVVLVELKLRPQLPPEQGLSEHSCCLAEGGSSSASCRAIGSEPGTGSGLLEHWTEGRGLHPPPQAPHARPAFLPPPPRPMVATIANLLEGRVPFTPGEAEEEPPLPGPSVPNAQSPASPPPATLPLKVFARSPEARHLSLQDRKHALFDYARRRYTEKHGMPQS